ncbi:MAG: PqqD family peptide modification chaperone [Anaerolineae bacterium]|jgi:organic radical activating enzyme|nr:PqqD family peptide modification chaperone [Anaerolineae bacterium]
MKFLNDLLELLFPPVEPLKPGLYSYRPQDEDDFPFPMHLRIESPDHALLIVNASTVLHLNQTAAEFIHGLIINENRKTTIKELSRRYDIPKETLSKDYDDLLERLNTMMTTPDLDPVSFLDFERQTPYSGELHSPYRLDLALTYRNNESDGVNEELRKRAAQELTEEQWLEIIEKTWKISVPQVIFTGGEPTLQDFLPKLIAAAEKNGQVTGLLTNGIKLADPEYMNLLLNQGLDNLMLVLDPQEEACWEAIANLMPEDIHVTVHLTIDRDDYAFYSDILANLRSQDVDTLSLSTCSKALEELLHQVNELAINAGFEIIWDLPVPYSTLNPVELELEGDELRAQGNAWLYVEPDGDVLQAQGQTEVLGNILNDDWDEIWSKARA